MFKKTFSIVMGIAAALAVLALLGLGLLWVFVWFLDQPDHLVATRELLLWTALGVAFCWLIVHGINEFRAEYRAAHAKAQRAELLRDSVWTDLS